MASHTSYDQPLAGPCEIETKNLLPIFVVSQGKLFAIKIGLSPVVYFSPDSLCPEPKDRPILIPINHIDVVATCIQSSNRIPVRRVVDLCSIGALSKSYQQILGVGAEVQTVNSRTTVRS